MKAWIQRVTEASVTIGGETVASIGRGYLVLLGVTHSDTEKDADELAARVVALRIFEDAAGKTNLSIQDAGGSVIIVSQFTLYADCRKGNRPNFLMAKEPAEAKRLYEYFAELCRREIPVVETGEFGADMKVESINDGPVTLILDTDQLMDTPRR